jgi:tetratricopeptide (TPR) repeat protein
MRITPILISGLLALGACGSTLNDAQPEPEVVINDEGEFQGDFELHMANAQDYYDAGDYYRARDQFSKAAGQRPDELGARLGEGFSLYHIGFNSAALGNLGQADKELGRAEKTFSEIWTGELPASTFEGTGMDWKSALGLAMTWRARASLDRMRIARIDSELNTATGEETAELLEEQRQRDLRRGRNLKKATELFSRLAAMQYAAPDAIKNLGDMELINGRPRAALTAYERYLDISRRNIANWEKRREEWPAQYEFERYALEAQTAIDNKRESAIEKTAEVLVQVAEIRFKNELYDLALADLQEAQELAPKRVELNVPIAECYERIGDKDQALRHLDTFLRSRAEMDGDTRRALKLRARLTAEVGN